MNSTHFHINLYGEEFDLNPPSNFEDFKKEIAKNYALEMEDVNELKISYLNKEIINEETYNALFQAKDIVINIILEIRQTSKIYLAEEEKLAKDEEKYIIESQIKNNESSIPQNNKVVHQDVICSHCKKSPIEGIRYKCLRCDNYDLCEDCEKQFAQEHGHTFLKIRKPEFFNNNSKKFLNKFFKHY